MHLLNNKQTNNLINRMTHPEISSVNWFLLRNWIYRAIKYPVEFRKNPIE